MALTPRRHVDFKSIIADSRNKLLNSGAFPDAKASFGLHSNILEEPFVEPVTIAAFPLSIFYW
jgi:hypothetical protein